MSAIGHAVTILGWFEHLTEDDLPPEWMWHLPHELERHFEMIKERHSSGTSSSDRDEGDVTMIRNEYARGRGPAVQVAHG